MRCASKMQRSVRPDPASFTVSSTHPSSSASPPGRDTNTGSWARTPKYHRLTALKRTLSAVRSTRQCYATPAVVFQTNNSVELSPGTFHCCCPPDGLDVKGRWQGPRWKKEHGPVTPVRLGLHTQDLNWRCTCVKQRDPGAHSSMLGCAVAASPSSENVTFVSTFRRQESGRWRLHCRVGSRLVPGCYMQSARARSKFWCSGWSCSCHSQSITMRLGQRQGPASPGSVPSGRGRRWMTPTSRCACAVGH